MSDTEVDDGQENTSGAEPIPDVLGAVEAGRPVDPEMPRFEHNLDASLPETHTTNDDIQLRNHRVRFLQDTDRYSWTAPGSLTLFM
uniref:Uncharacterized protein n=1 Tax=Bracon brevicornis TaxID=1563983 RepID=A0A6V7JSN5_9HYME